MENSATKIQEKATKHRGEPPVTTRGTRRIPEFPQLAGRASERSAQALSPPAQATERASRATSKPDPGGLLSPRPFQEAAAPQLGHRLGLKRLLAKNRLKQFVSLHKLD